MLTAERLRELLDYDKETGVFRYKKRSGRGAPVLVGALAGGGTPNRYWRIAIDGERYYAHRLAWLHVYGEWPMGDIEHIDRDKNNNAISNLKVFELKKGGVLTQQRLHELLFYDEKTGTFTWTNVINGVKENGSVAGNARCGNKNYRLIGIDTKKYYAHQLAWLYVYGVLPKQVDHMDGDGLNNAIANLRLATSKQNQGNRKVDKRNTLSVKGVRKHTDNCYSARMAGRHLGCFKTIEEAHQAYFNAAKEYFGEFARG
jgi:HNH endonuclease